MTFACCLVRLVCSWLVSFFSCTWYSLCCNAILARHSACTSTMRTLINCSENQRDFDSHLMRQDSASHLWRNSLIFHLPAILTWILPTKSLILKCHCLLYWLITPHQSNMAVPDSAVHLHRSAFIKLSRQNATNVWLSLWVYERLQLGSHVNVSSSQILGKSLWARCEKLLIKKKPGPF